jgi:myo-inositol-1(or 4)-monophosphatase
MSDSTGLAQRHLAAIATARQAGDLMRRLFLDRDGIEMSFKGPQDYLTQADAAVEKVVRQHLHEAFPGDTFFGEEHGGEFSASCWVVDPIDGTANFALGVPHFCISIAYMRDGAPVIGVIYNPMTDELFEARTGDGARLNGKAMRISKTTAMNRAMIELGWSARRSATDYADMLCRVLGTGASFRRAGSGALGIAYVADGRSDGYVELHINSWDCLAGIVMAKEAGALVNDFLAGDGLRQGNTVLAVTPGIAEALIAATGVRTKVMA